MNRPNAPMLKDADLPATRGMLRQVRAEFIKKFLKLERTIESKFMAQDSRLKAMDASIADLASQVERSNLLVEEQNANNRIVLDGLAALWERQDRLEAAFRAT